MNITSSYYKYFQKSWIITHSYGLMFHVVTVSVAAQVKLRKSPKQNQNL